MSDDRSERLRKRRKQSTAHVEQPRDGATDQPATSTRHPDSSRPSSSGRDEDDSSASGEDSSIKDEQVGTYMYLPETQTKDLRRLYNVLKAEYEFEYDAEFEKNRHFYPLVIQYGLDQLDGLDASEIRTCLEELQ